MQPVSVVHVVSNDIPHDEVMAWLGFPQYLPFVREIHRLSFDVFIDVSLDKVLNKMAPMC